MRKLSHSEIVHRQQSGGGAGRIPFTVVLNNIRSLYNVGSVFRTADGVGAEKLWLCGITGYPPQAQIAKTALGAELRVPWEYHRDVLAVIERYRSDGYDIVLLEQTDRSIDYHQYVPEKPVCLVIGNEIEGVSAEAVTFCDRAVEIAMHGIKNSLNVGVAFGIVAYHIRQGLIHSGRGHGR